MVKEASETCKGSPETVDIFPVEDVVIRAYQETTPEPVFSPPKHTLQRWIAWVQHSHRNTCDTTQDGAVGPHRTTARPPQPGRMEPRAIKL